MIPFGPDRWIAGVTRRSKLCAAMRGDELPERRPLLSLRLTPLSTQKMIPTRSLRSAKVASAALQQRGAQPPHLSLSLVLASLRPSKGLLERRVGALGVSWGHCGRVELMRYCSCFLQSVVRTCSSASRRPKMLSPSSRTTTTLAGVVSPLGFLVVGQGGADLAFRIQDSRESDTPR